MRGIRASVVVLLIMITTGCGLIPTPPRPSPAPTPRGLPAPLTFHQVTEERPGACSSAGPGLTFPDPSNPQSCLVLGPSRLTVDRLQQVRSEADQTGAWTVQITLPSEAAAELAVLTTELARRQGPANRMAMIIGEELIIAAAVMDPIPSGEVQIAGGFTRDEADALAVRLGG